MPDWFWGLLLLGGCIGLSWVWSSVTDRSPTAAAIEDAVGAGVHGLRWLIMKATGLGALVLIGVGLASGWLEGELIFFAIVLGVYGGYLLWPGGPDERSLWPL